MTVPLPFLASEIVEPLAGFLTSVIASSVPSKPRPGCKAVIWGGGLALFVSSIAFVIPIFNNNMFSVVVFLLRRSLQTRKKVQIL